MSTETTIYRTSLEEIEKTIRERIAQATQAGRIIGRGSFGVQVRDEKLVSNGNSCCLIGVVVLGELDGPENSFTGIAARVLGIDLSEASILLSGFEAFRKPLETEREKQLYALGKKLYWEVVGKHPKG